MLTIHRSKGLEFPVVYFPYLWEPTWVPTTSRADRLPRPRRRRPPHDRRRARRPGLPAPQATSTSSEQRGEDLRLAYVALTRAKHQAVVWWAGPGTAATRRSRGCCSRATPTATSPPSGPRPPTDDAATARFRELAARGARAASASSASALGLPGRAGRARRARRAALDAPRASTATLDRAGAAPPTATSPPAPTSRAWPASPRRPRVDRRAGAAAAAGRRPRDGRDDARCARSRRCSAAMPAASRVGTFVHRVLEATDFAAADLDAELRRAVGEALARRPVDIGDAATSSPGCAPRSRRRSARCVGGLRLRDVARADRLDELDVRAAAGRRRRADGAVTLGRDRRRAARAPAADDPLAGYADRLDDPSCGASVRGYLTGSIDLVAARPATALRVVDYKTNWLGARRGADRVAPPPGGAGGRDGARHYGLQALLYTVALHRYLRWRLPGYDPERHLAGVLYLFVRGMTGPATPAVDGTPCGVFAWRPPARARRGAQRRARPGRACARSPTTTRSTSAALADAPGLLRDVQRRPACSRRPTSTSRCGSRALAGEDDEPVALAAALAVRAPRLGHVCVDLATIRETATVEPTSPSTSRRCRGPRPSAWLARLAREPARRGRRGRRGATARCGSSARALPRPLLARGAPGRRRPARARRRAGRRRRARCSPTGSRGCSAAERRRASSARPRRPRCCARFAVVAGGPGTGKTTTVARIVALLAEQAAAGAPPLVALAAPTGKAAARLEEAVHAEAREARRRAERPRRAARARGLDAAPAARLAAGQPQPLPPRPRATGCRTTS